MNDAAILALQNELDKDVDDLDVWGKFSGNDPRGVIGALIEIICDNKQNLLRRIHAASSLQVIPNEIVLNKSDISLHVSKIMSIIAKPPYFFSFSKIVSNVEKNFYHEFVNCAAVAAAAMLERADPTLKLLPKSWRETLTEEDNLTCANYIGWLDVKIREILREE